MSFVLTVSRTAPPAPPTALQGSRRTGWAVGWPGAQAGNQTSSLQVLRGGASSVSEPGLGGGGRALVLTRCHPSPPSPPKPDWCPPATPKKSHSSLALGRPLPSAPDYPRAAVPHPPVLHQHAPRIIPAGNTGRYYQPQPQRPRGLPPTTECQGGSPHPSWARQSL